MVCVAFRDRIPARYVLCLMLFFGSMVTFLLRVNINMAIVAMVARGATEDVIRPSSGACAHVPSTINLTSISNTTVQEPTEEGGEFIWDDMQQSLILGSFFWGYLLFQVPGGLLAEVYGPKVVLGGSVFINGALSVLLPLATRQHWYLLLVIRAMQGVAQGAQYPVLSAAVVRWVPLEERARFVSFAVQGASLGTVLALPLCGVVVSTWGWEAVFYGSGLIAAAWCLAWAGLVFDSPDQHPRISRKECLYLRDHLPCTPPGRLPVPWRRVWTSRQFLIACVAALGNDWGFHTLITLGPKYMKENLGFDLEQSSFMASLPFLCQYVFANVYGSFADCLLKVRQPVVRVRKLSVIIANIIPAAGLIVMTFIGCDVVFSVTLLTLSFTTVGAFTSGYFQTPLDIAPNFAGSLTGMMNAVGSLTGIISPPLAGAVLNNLGAAQGWRVIFLIAASMYFLCSIPYLLFATARIQPWNGVVATLDDRLRQVPMIQSGDFNAKTDDEPEKS